MKLGIRAVAGLIWLTCLASAEEGQLPYVDGQAAADRMALVTADALAPVYAEAGDHEVVRVAAADLVADIERVTGRKPVLSDARIDMELRRSPLPRAIIIGSLNRSEVIRGMVKAGKLDVSKVAGQWEAFTLQVVADPVAGVGEALVIAGSDRRGTAYGVYELSRRIGVSPWYWWADVVPEKREQLHVLKTPLVVGSPGVKYRGIFINDEMWGIRPWAEGTFAPEEGRGLGPKTYAKVFELLLRLRANTIWPAMHRGTKAFHQYEGNKLVADRHAIVMGGSHTEVMNRNQMHGAEWDAEHGGEWNYFTQPKAIQDYWVRGVKAWGQYENLYTVGMRGRDDEPMFGPKDKQARIEMMNRIFKDQRDIIARHVNPDPTQVPQTLVAYSEVLDLYHGGMQVPDDVIFCWPEDNFGYIRCLPDERERKRSGGSGIYYHIQWLNGATSAYTWLNTMPPSLICAEMNKAWQYDCRKLWILNVGDIKPGEVGMNLFLEMAWAPERWTPESIGGYLEEWAARDLSAPHAAEIAAIMKEYYQLAFQRRPEHLVQFAGKMPLMHSWFSHSNYGDEAARRLERYADIARRAEALYAAMPESRKAAFYQLVLYPVKCSSLMNHKVIHADRSGHDAGSGRATARVHAQLARAAAEEIIAMTELYNERMPGVGAKWRHMIHWSPGPWGGQRHQYETPPLSDFNGLGKPALLVVPEGVQPDMLADLSVYTREKRFVDLFNTGKGEIHWQAKADVPWIRLDRDRGSFTTGERLWVDVDWVTAPKGEELTAEMVFTSAAGEFTLGVKVFNPASPARDAVQGHVESHGCVCIEAEHFSRSVQRGGAHWLAVEGLGRCADAVLVQPALLPSRTTPQEIATQSPCLEYDFHVFHAGAFETHFDLLPTLPVAADRGVRLAISLDDGPIRIAGEGVEQKPNPWVGKGHAGWDKLINLRRVYERLQIDQPGKHTLKVWMVDPGVILDRMVIYTEAPRESYLGPSESFFGKAEMLKR